MTNKKAKILFFCMIFVAAVSQGQTSATKRPALLLLHSFSNPLPESILLKKKLAVLPVPSPLFSPAFYANNLGFVCKQEIKLEKITRIPIKFRLGSVAACDRLEGKPNAQ